MKKKIVPYLFLIPSACFFVFFTLIPILVGLALSFFKWNIISTPSFIFLKNWNAIFRRPEFFQSMIVTIKFLLINVPFSLALGIFLAMLVDNIYIGKRLFRSIFFAPVITSSVALSFIMKAMFRTDTGVLNYILKFFHIEGIRWLTHPSWAIISCVMFILWHGLGNSMIIFLAGLQGIPKEIYEASAIDGAEEWRKFFKITFPLLSPAIFFVLVTTTISSLQIFDQIYTLTQGGPGNATRTLVFLIHNSAFVHYKMGYAATYSVILFIFIMGIILVQWKNSDRWVFYG